MLLVEKQKLSEVLVKAAAALDIPDHVYEDAVLKYEGVGEWLGAEDSELNFYSPEIYPQGSFRLGTVVQPIAKYDYDIDLVCLLAMTREETTQKNLKQMVGERLKKHSDLKQIISPSCRCWLLDYPKELNMPGFHMDVLPSMPNPERTPTGILLTDTELARWQKSDPKAYADWFYGRMKLILVERRAELAKASNVNVEEVPEWQIKTPLQVAIQLLKRHRDIFFEAVPTNRPASIILNTLAALSYRNQPNVYDALTDITRDMSKFIEYRGDKWWLPNPVEPEENFTDRWNRDPARKDNFTRWLTKAQSDFSQLLRKQRLEEVIESLKPSIGPVVMAKVAADLGLQVTLPAVTSQVSVPALGDVQHRKTPPWPVQIRYSASVVTSVHYVKNGKTLQFTRRTFPKGVWLRFKLQTDTPYPYSVAWQVVNSGKEASEAGQLRGQFYDGDGRGHDVRWEQTKFRGTHWVEAFVIKDGVCFARSGQVFVKIR